MPSEHLPAAEKGPQESTSPNYAKLYKEAHSDAVDDPEKARVMEHASDAPETAGVKARQDATQALLDIKDESRAPEDESIGSPRDDRMLDAHDHLSAAQRHRKQADEESDYAARMYDSIQATKTSPKEDGPTQVVSEENR
jgi:hypothetical protein